MFTSTLIRSSARALRSPVAIRMASNEGAGSVASDKAFSAREKGQEDWYIRKAEKEKLAAMLSKAQQELAAKQAEVAEIEKKHKENLDDVEQK